MIEMRQSATPADTTESLAHHKFQFRQIANEISTLAADSNIQITPFYNSELPAFSKVDAGGRENILQGLRVLKELCDGALSDNIRLEEGKKFAWFAMRKLGLRPPSDLFDKIKDNDIIEIHNTERQIFRCFSYFQVCSYSLEELTSIPWHELYHRNQFLEEQMMNAGRETLQSQKIQFPNIREHLVEESRSPFRYQGRYSVQLVSPLTSDAGRADHLLVAVQINLMNKRSAQEQEEMLRQYHARANN